ncbi:MAG: LytR/AlgR family response regulator transcription factor [bacterium]
MVRTLVVDDDPPARRRLSFLLAELGASVAGTAGTAAEAFRLLDRGPVDAAFLDVRLPEIDGLALGDRLRRSGVPVVFVTGFPDYALSAFELGAADYLLKPVSRDRLGRALARVSGGPSVRESAGVDRLCVREGEGRVLLPVRGVLYARRDGGITTMTLEQEAVRLRLPLGRLERVLAPHGFFRSHRAFLVNLRRVRRIVPWSRDAQSLLLDDAKETLIPLAKSRVQDLRGHLLWP